MFADKDIPRLIAADVMTGSVTSCDELQTITEVIEILSERKLEAILVTKKGNFSQGIISKTDLLFSYVRGVGLALTSKYGDHRLTLKNMCLARHTQSKYTRTSRLFVVFMAAWPLYIGQLLRQVVRD